MLSGWAVHAIALGCLCTCLQLIMQVVASDASATTRPDLTAVFTSGEKDERGFAINSFRIPGFLSACSAACRRVSTTAKCRNQVFVTDSTDAKSIEPTKMPCHPRSTMNH